MSEPKENKIFKKIEEDYTTRWHNQFAFHLAGIVPVAGPPLNFKMPWHDSMMPIKSDYMAVERAVHECACAGCETIWIVCNDDITPLLRYRLGDFAIDPVSIQSSKYFRFYHTGLVLKYIPIFYVPVFVKDVKRRDCYGWSVVHGALVSYAISRTIARWVVPNRFYVAFPYGVYCPDIVIEYRKDFISSRRNQNFFLSYENKTIRDGEYLGFAFGYKEVLELKKFFYKEGTGIFLDRYKKLPVSERNSGVNFTLDKIFSNVTIEGAKVVEVPDYQRIDSVGNYAKYWSSNVPQQIRRPYKVLKKGKEQNLLNSWGLEEEEKVEEKLDGEE